MRTPPKLPELVALRKARGLSQDKLATALGIGSKSYVCDVERTGRASAKIALKIESWSGGAIKAHELNESVALTRNV